MNLKMSLADESYKYKPGEKICHDKPGISLVAARRDWVAFQVLMQGDECFTLSVGDNTVFSPRINNAVGADKTKLHIFRLHVSINSLPSAEIRMYPVGLINDDDGIAKADILLHNETVFVGYEQVQPVWVEIAIPEDVQPGVYQGDYLN